MDIRFDKKKALVTGAGKGIGRALAKALDQGGAETFALSRTQADLDSLKEECPGIHAVCVDLADWDATRKAVQDIGVIDLLVNNAAVGFADMFHDIKREHLDSILDVNLKAIFNVSQVVAKGMVERGQGGSIVNLSGAGSRLASEMFGACGVAKAGVDQLTRVMALELGPHQIRVNAVNPTLLETNSTKGLMSDPESAMGQTFKKWKEERIPLRRFPEVKDVVHPVLYLLSDKADMINGVTLLVDGGHTIC